MSQAERKSCADHASPTTSRRRARWLGLAFVLIVAAGCLAERSSTAELEDAVAQAQVGAIDQDIVIDDGLSDDGSVAGSDGDGDVGSADAIADADILDAADATTADADTTAADATADAGDGTADANDDASDDAANVDGAATADADATATICSAGETTCQSGQLATCAADGMAWTLSDCAKADICLNGACVASACAAGATSCADALTLATCKADGSGWTQAPCGDKSGCVNGACTAQTCTPGAKTCVGAVVAVCDASGTKLAPGQDCDNSGLLCAAGACVAKQAGFAGQGAFVQAPSVATKGFRVHSQGFTVRQVCGQGFCVRGGLRP